MKIFRWLFSNLVLILMIVAVVYSYRYWGNLAGNDTPAGKAIAYLSSEFVEVEEFINAIKAKQQEKQQAKANDFSKQQDTKVAKTTGSNTAPTVVSKVENPPAKTKVSTTPTAKTNEKSVVSFKSDILQQPPVTISYSQNRTRIKQNSAGVVESLSPAPAPKPVVVRPQNASQKTALLPNSRISQSKNTSDLAIASKKIPSAANVSSKDAFVSEEVEKQLDNVDKNGQLIDPSLQSSDVRSTWVIARKSYYQRNYDLSEKSYQNVIKNTEDNYDAYGELGNVYFNQGKNDQAATAYYEAASILVRNGQINRARSLTGLLRHLDKTKASDLQGLIDSAKPASTSKIENKS